MHGNPFVVGRETPPSFHQSSLDLFVEEMGASEVTHGVIMGQRAATKWGNASNDDIAQIVSQHSGLFSGFAGVEPNGDALAEAKRAIEELGLSGIALVPGWADPPVADDADELMGLYAWCESAGVPVSITASHFIGPDMLHSHPVHVQRVAMEFPELTLIVAHGGWPWTRAAIALAMRCTNVYLMPDFYMYLPNMPGAQDYVDAANGFLKHRMLYSSCYPSNSLRQALAHFRSLSLSEDAMEHLLFRNARRLLGKVA